MKFIIRVSQWDGVSDEDSVRRLVADDFETVIEFVLEFLNLHPQATIDVYDDVEEAHTHRLFAWRAAENVHVVGRTLLGGKLEETINLLDLQEARP